MVTFLTLPGDTRVPGTYVEVDPDRTIQSPRIQPYRILVIGQKLSAGTQATLSLVEVRTANQGRTLFGRGSQLAQMLERLLAVHKNVPVFAFAVADPSGSPVQATGTITYTGTSTASGDVVLYVGGRRVAATIGSGSTPTQIATAVAAAITALPDLSVSATSALGVVTVTSKQTGTIGNLIDLRHNYFDGEALPAGVSAAIVAMASGAGDVLLSTVWPEIGDEWFNLFVIGAHDATNLTSVENEMLDRFGPIRQIDASAVVARVASLATTAAFGLTRNSKHLVILGAGSTPTNPWEVAAQASGQVAVEAQADPARPFETLPLPDVLSPARDDRFTFANRQELLESGIATVLPDSVGVVRLERLITTYRLDETGIDDEAYLDHTTLATISFLRWDFRTAFRQKYARYKIGEDGVRYASGQPILTPSGARAEALAKFREWQERGLVEDFEQFQRDLLVERNAQDASRFDFFLPVNLTNGLIVVGVRLSFRL